MQLSTVITNDASPTTFTYPIGAEPGARLEQSGDAVLILDASGAYAGGIAAPWAKDANGVDVPTHYEIDGMNLVQVVEHNTGDFAYPVVADPWVGINLFNTVKRYNYSGWYKISAALSGWGRTIHTSGYLGTPGILIMQTAGWSEVVSRQPSANIVTINQQYQCHVLGGLFEWATWDFESNRAPNGNFIAWAGSLCNW